MPTERDVYKPERWRDDALFAPEVRETYARLVAQGWTDALRTLHPDETIYTYWDYFRNAYARNAGLRIDHLLLSPALAPQLVAADVITMFAAGRNRAITSRSGSNWRTRPFERPGAGHGPRPGARLSAWILRGSTTGWTPRSPHAGS